MSLYSERVAVAGRGVRPRRSPPPIATLDTLFPLIYDDLRHLASRWLRGRHLGPEADPIGLVHEVYLALASQHRAMYREPGHLFAVAAIVLRRRLLDLERRSRRRRHGAGMRHVAVCAANEPRIETDDDSRDLHEALQRLERLDARKARVVELHGFNGLTFTETAVILHISLATTKRDWVAACTFLRDAFCCMGI